MPWVLMPRSWIGRLYWLHRLTPQTRSRPLIATGVRPTGGFVVVVVVVVVDVVDVLVVEPVQATPFSVNDVGAGLLPDHEATKPRSVDAPVPSVRFQSTLVAVAVEPDCAHVAFQPWVTR